MNKNILKIFTVVSLLCLPALAEDATTGTVSERMDCTSMQEKISELAAIESPDEATTNQLNQLKERYRRDCSKSASGRTTSGRVSTLAAAAVAPAPVSVKEVEKDAAGVLEDYIAQKTSNCETLKNAIDTMTMTEEEKAKLQSQYDADCVNIVAEDKVEEISEEEKAANLAAGLCADGSKPNRFGCCEGETFKDLGNLQFACCPDDGGECYTPMNSGTLL